MKAMYDTVVVGGGAAGIVAAVQSARAGADTLLVEKNGILGGTITAGGVGFPGLFHAWGRQVIAGIGWELVSKTVKEGGGSLPDFSVPPQQHWMHQVRVDRALFAALADEMVLSAGGDLLFHTMIANVRDESDAVRVTLCTKGGLCEVSCRILVDCTGDANATAIAGYALTCPDTCQPGTLWYRLSGYDADDLDVAGIERAFEAAVAKGFARYTDAGRSGERSGIRGWLTRGGPNGNHIVVPRAYDSEGRTRAEVEGRRAFLRLWRFLRGQPGMQDVRVDYMAPECGVRESAMIVGEETITVGDYTSGRKWADALCYAFYPVDLHTVEGNGLDLRPLGEGIVPGVPRGALVPAGSRRMLVAGRCVSSDRLANSALRVQASCVAMGQAAGALAAQSVVDSALPRNVDLASVRALLRKHGAIVPWDLDVAPTATG